MHQTDLDVGVCKACRSRLVLHMDRVTDAQSGEGFAILRCAECGLGLTSPAPFRITDYYGGRYYGNRHSGTVDFCVWRRRRILDAAVADRQRGKLLDVGCGDGAFLAAAARVGWEVTGMELNEAQPMLRGLPICGTLDDAARLGPYRSITLWHVLEHLSDPLGNIRRFHRMLAPDGVLLLAVPDFGGLQAKLSGRHWFHFDVPRHYHHFTLTALSKLLDSGGFRISKRWGQELEYDWFGWIQSASNAIMGEPNILFDALTGKPRRVSRLRLAAAYFAATVLAGPALLLTLVCTLAGRGSTLIVAARPKPR